MARLLAVVFALFLSGCAPFVLVEPKPATIGQGLVVHPTIPWNQQGSGKSVIWTLDGPALQRLAIHGGLEDGDALDKVPRQGDNNKPPIFRSTMTEMEITDLFTTTFARVVGVPPILDGITPAKFAGHAGFRFDYSFVGKDNVRRKGFAAGAIIDKRLYMIDYNGTALYHFGKDAEEAHRIIASSQVVLPIH